MDKDQRDLLFQQLLLNTQGANHGTHPNYQEDDQGPLWEYASALTHEQSKDLLGSMSDDLVAMLPYPTEFLMLWGDEDDIYALYNRNGDYHLIRAEGARYYRWLLRNYRQRTEAQDKARDTLGRVYGNLSTLQQRAA